MFKNLTIFAASAHAIDLKFLVIGNGDLYNTDDLTNPGLSESYA